MSGSAHTAQAWDEGAGRTCAVLPLPDERYWGRPIEDERYLVRSPA